MSLKVKCINNTEGLSHINESYSWKYLVNHNDNPGAPLLDAIEITENLYGITYQRPDKGDVAYGIFPKSMFTVV